MTRDGQTVLLVEADVAMRELLHAWLEAAGLRVCQLPEPQGDVEAQLRGLALAPEAPSVIVSDVLLGPRSNGVTLARAVRKLFPKTGVLLMSADPDEQLQRRALELGNTELMRKPFSAQGFLRCVRQLLQR